MVRLPNPVRLVILAVGVGLARLGLVDAERGRRTVDLAWPRIITGLARTSKSAADVAMVGVAVGPAAIAGVGFASPYWSVSFTIGSGVAAGTIALVSSRFSAEAYGQLGQAARTSLVLVVLGTLPFVALFWFFPTALIGLLSNDPTAIRLGAAYLRVIAVGAPFGALTLIFSRILIGADDAWTPMVVMVAGAALNIGLNAVFIFALDMGVVGAALGTLFSHVAVTGLFVVGLVGGRLPVAGTFPVTISPRGRYVDPGTIRDLVRISTPVIGRNSTWTLARFPMLAIIALFGPAVVAAYVVSRRIFSLMNAPGWGFGLAASSLVGQSLGLDDEATAEAYGREIVLMAVVTYVLGAAAVFVLAEPVVLAFVEDPGDATVPVAVNLVRAACFAVVARGVGRTVAGALDATGDTRWPFYSRLLGMFGFMLPLTYLGATTALGLLGLYLAYLAQTFVPAAINYYRFRTGHWKEISQQYRPDAPAADD